MLSKQRPKVTQPTFRSHGISLTAKINIYPTVHQQRKYINQQTFRNITQTSTKIMTKINTNAQQIRNGDLLIPLATISTK